MRIRRTLIALGAGLLVGLLGVALYWSPLGTNLEQQVGLSWLFHLRGRLPPPAEVAVVAIDGRTGTALGLPALPRDWPRSVHGDLVRALHLGGATAVVFDIHFAQSRDTQSDSDFSQAVAAAGNVVLVERLSGRREPVTDAQGRNVGMVWTEQLQPPFAELARAAAGLATFTLPKEAASIWEYWVFKESTDRAPTLPGVALQLAARQQLPWLVENIKTRLPQSAARLAVAEHAFDDAETLRATMRELHAVVSDAPPEVAAALLAEAGPAGDRRRALAAMYAGDANRLLNFYGPPGSIQTLPYQAVLHGQDPNLSQQQLDVSGKVVFVGYADLYDPGQPDRFYTVFTRDDGVDLSGVEIAATAYANLLHDSALRTPDTDKALAAVLGFGLVLGTLAFSLPALIGVPLLLGLVLLYCYGALHAFTTAQLLLPFATPLLVQAPLAVFLGLLGQYLLERRRGERISKAINYYLPDEIARDLAENRLDPSRLNQVVYATCLATDMAGFSTVAEKLPPGELATFLNEYFEALAAPLKKYGVHVTEFRADAIMCAWTADQPSLLPRERALQAALEAAEAIKAFKLTHDMPAARLRIGLEVGHVFIGHAGGGGRFVYSIVGDSANTASRVEGLNKHVGTEILATGGVIEGVADLLVRYLGDFQFVGKSDATPVYEVVARNAQADASQIELGAAFAVALANFHAGHWAQAALEFGALLARHPDDGPSAFYLARSERFASDPPTVGASRVVRMDAK